MDYNSMRHSTTHPKFLHSNSTSHKFAFGAVAELVDNSVDASATVLKIDIFPEVPESELTSNSTEETNGEDKDKEKGEEGEGEGEEKEGEEINNSHNNNKIQKIKPTQLIFTDNGSGMNSDGVHKMLSFGHCDKEDKDGFAFIGHYGNGFKSGSMRLGRSVLVFSTDGFTRSVGLLSQTFLEVTNAVEVLVPLASWFIETKEYCLSTEGMDRDLKIIYEFSPFKSLEELLAQFAAIGKRGTRIVIFELRRKDDNESLEFSFEIDSKGMPDICLVEDIESAILPQSNGKEANIYHYSLRAYLSILYLNPRMQVLLRGRKIRSQRLLYNLYKPEQFLYTPRDNGQSVVLTFGFTKRNYRTEYGLMMYNKGRLIKSFLRVGIQLNPASPGIGVMGIVDTTLVEPTHNKQDFIYDKNYNLLINTMKEKLSVYWKSLKAEGQLRSLFGKVEKAASQGPYFVQCDQCLKWRNVNKPAESYPEKWNCSMHDDPKQNACIFEEEQISPIEASKRYFRKRSKPANTIEKLEADLIHIKAQKAEEKLLEKVKKLRQAKAKKIAKDTDENIDRVYIALRVTEGNEEDAKKWLVDNDNFDTTELQEMYGGSDVHDMGDEEISFYDNNEEDVDIEGVDDNNADVGEGGDFLRYSQRKRKATSQFNFDQFGQTPKRINSSSSSSSSTTTSTSTTSSTPTRSKAAKSSSSSTPSSSSKSSSSSSSSKSPAAKTSSYFSSKSSSSYKPASKSSSSSSSSKSTSSSKSPASKSSSSTSSSSSSSSNKKKTTSSTRSNSSSSLSPPQRPPSPQLPLSSRRKSNPSSSSSSSSSVVPTRSASTPATTRSERDEEENIPPGMTSDSDQHLCYDHSMHYSTKCVWCKVVCDKLRRLFSELSGKPFNCGDVLDQDVDVFIDKIARNFRNNIISAPRSSRTKRGAQLFNNTDKSTQARRMIQSTSRIKRETDGASTEEEDRQSDGSESGEENEENDFEGEDNEHNEDNEDMEQNGENGENEEQETITTHIHSPQIKQSPPPSPPLHAPSKNIPPPSSPCTVKSEEPENQITSTMTLNTTEIEDTEMETTKSEQIKERERETEEIEKQTIATEPEVIDLDLNSTPTDDFLTIL